MTTLLKSMNTTHASLIAALSVGLAFGAQADVIELKNGQVLNGKYVGGTAGTVRFETGGNVTVVETGNIVALTFTTAAPAAAAAAPAAPVAPAAPAAPAPAAPAAAAATVTIPAGTTLLVRLMDGISSKNDSGTPFTCKLEYDLRAGDAVAAKGGAVVYGKVQSSTQARRAVGKSTLDLRLTQIVIGGQPVPIMTSSYREAGEASIKKAARGAAGGAAIGAIAGDAGKGAAIGATVGALKRGETVTMTPGTLIEFDLTQPVTIKPAP